MRYIDLCDNSTPLGKPVVPLENNITQVCLLSYGVGKKSLFSSIILLLQRISIGQTYLIKSSGLAVFLTISNPIFDVIIIFGLVIFNTCVNSSGENKNHNINKINDIIFLKF